jgi:hypothetical protein
MLRLVAEAHALHESAWSECLEQELARIGRRPQELQAAGKSTPWKVELAVKLKRQTTVTNRWLSAHLHLGAVPEVSRKLHAWRRRHTEP